ncbi:MAG: dipeptide epimerase [Phycisphaerales bacterium]|nr:dipeptide epimerase [Phycisphaerales bacterium]
MAQKPRLSWNRQTLRPRHRFATSQGGVTEKQTIVVRLEHEGVVGLGEVAPSKLYGQTLESSEAALGGMAELIGNDPFRIESIIASCLGNFDDQRAAIGGLDSALHDWAARRWGVPVWRILGLDRPSVRTTFTIGVAEPDETRQKVDEALAAGFTALKVKVGAERDHETLSMIRSRFGGALFLDANEAWTPGEARRRIADLARYRPTMIEQPLARADWEHLRGLRDLGVAPIFVDESCQRPADVLRLANAVDGVNIKFTKCGGIREALRMIWLARGLGLKTMLGCFVSSSLAIAPALSIASLVDYCDLDGALLLADDPFDGIARDGSVISLGGLPGLGVSPAGAALKSHT